MPYLVNPNDLILTAQEIITLNQIIQNDNTLQTAYNYLLIDGRHADHYIDRGYTVKQLRNGNNPSASLVIDPLNA